MPSYQTANGRPRKERKENADMRRRQVLDAAQRSIATHGLSKTTLATVADQAGLSQGVAVFYFKSKLGLLTETLRDLYQKYDTNWNEALDAAGPDPVDRLVALIAADFSPEVCSPEILSIWFAFWAEQKITPQYGDITRDYSERRDNALSEICTALLPDAPDRAQAIAEWVDMLTDGYWQNLYLLPKSHSAAESVRESLHFLAALLPEYAPALKAAAPVG